MAKAKPDWIKARALYEAGESFRQIASKTFIDHSQIAKVSKKEGWERIDEIPRLVADSVSVAVRKSTLSTPQLDYVDKAVEKQLEGMMFYRTQARKVVQKTMALLDEEPSIVGANTTMKTLKEGLVVEGLVPFYPNAPTINNTNAQQNNSDDLLKKISECLPN